MLETIDNTILLWIHQGWRSGPADAFFTRITEIDHFMIPLAAAWLALVVFGGRNGRILALLLALCLVATDQLASHVLKPLVARARPCFALEGVTALLPQVRSHSFPSSHASNMFGAATLFVLARGRRWLWTLIPATLVALSRVYVGVHYPSDVAAGAVLGILCAVVIWWGASRVRFLRTTKQPGRAPKMGDARRAILALACGILWLGGCGGDDAQPELDESLEVPYAADWITWADTVRRGDTFSSLLLRNRLYLRDIERVLRTVRERDLFSLRRLRPGEILEISMDFDGQLQKLQYEKSPDEVYVVEIAGDSTHAYETGLPYERFLRKLVGTVTTTVDEALRAAGADPRVVLELAVIFESDIDFLTEPRTGDGIVLLVEEKYFEGERVGLGPIHYVVYQGRKVSQTAIRFDPSQGRGGEPAYFTPEGESLVRTFLRSPLNYRRISSRYSRRRLHPILRVYRPHLGVDYAADTGTPVVALAEGVVSFAGWNGGFGRQVRIQHGRMYDTGYGHLSRFASGVRKGVRVKKGQTIGYVGASGLATGPHLDFRVRRNGAYIDPLKMKNPPTAPISGGAEQAFRAHAADLNRLVNSLRAHERVRWDSPAADSSVSRSSGAVAGVTTGRG